MLDDLYVTRILLWRINLIWYIFSSQQCQYSFSFSKPSFGLFWEYMCSLVIPTTVARSEQAIAYRSRRFRLTCEIQLNLFSQIPIFEIHPSNASARQANTSKFYAGRPRHSEGGSRDIGSVSQFSIAFSHTRLEITRNRETLLRDDERSTHTHTRRGVGRHVYIDRPSLEFARSLAG